MPRRGRAGRGRGSSRCPSAAAARRHPAPSGSTARGTDPSSTPFLEQPHDALRPGAVALLHERAQLLVVAQARPDLVPERRVCLERRIDRSQSARSARSAPVESVASSASSASIAEVLRVRESGPEQLLPRREVVVDERPRDAGLLRDGADSQVARAARDDDAAGGLQDLVDATRGGGRRRLLRFPPSEVS